MGLGKRYSVGNQPNELGVPGRKRSPEPGHCLSLAVPA